MAREQLHDLGMPDRDPPRSRQSAWRSPSAIVLTAMLLAVIVLIDTSSVTQEDLVRISGIQPGFARVIGGEKFGDQIVFADKSDQRCVLSTVGSRKTRTRIISASRLVILCNPEASPAQVYEVAVDGETVVHIRETLEANSFEHSLKRVSLPILAIIFLSQMAGLFIVRRQSRK